MCAHVHSMHTWDRHIQHRPVPSCVQTDLGRQVGAGHVEEGAEGIHHQPLGHDKDIGHLFEYVDEVSCGGTYFHRSHS